MGTSLVAAVAIDVLMNENNPQYADRFPFIGIAVMAAALAWYPTPKTKGVAQPTAMTAPQCQQFFDKQLTSRPQHQVNQLCRIPRFQFFHDVRTMAFHRLAANGKHGGNGFVGFAFDDHVEHLTLARRE